MKAPAVKFLSLTLLVAALALTARSPDGRVTVYVAPVADAAAHQFSELAVREGGRRYRVALSSASPLGIGRVTFVQIPQRTLPAIVLWQQLDDANTLDGMGFLLYDPHRGRYEQGLPLAFPTDAAAVWTSQGRISFTKPTRLAANTADYGEHVQQTEYAATADDGSLHVVSTTRAMGRERPDLNGCNELLAAGELRAIVGCMTPPVKGVLRARAGGASVASWSANDNTFTGLESILTYRGTTTKLVFPNLEFEESDSRPAAYAPNAMPPLVVYPFVQCGRDCSSVPEFVAFDARTHRFEPATLWNAQWSGESPQPAASHRHVDIVDATAILHSEYRSAIPIRAKTNTRYFYVRSAGGETAVLAITVNDGEAFPPATGCWDASRDQDQRFDSLSPCGGWPAIRGTPVPN